MSGERHCNFFGHLRHDSKACVAVTGCYPEENMELTINSKHSTESNMFVLEKSGNLVPVESAFKACSMYFIYLCYTFFSNKRFLLILIFWSNTSKFVIFYV